MTGCRPNASCWPQSRETPKLKRGYRECFRAAVPGDELGEESLGVAHSYALGRGARGCRAALQRAVAWACSTSGEHDYGQVAATIFNERTSIFVFSLISPDSSTL